MGVRNFLFCHTDTYVCGVIVGRGQVEKRLGSASEWLEILGFGFTVWLASPPPTVLFLIFRVFVEDVFV
jgi:hypothetical protein